MMIPAPELRSPNEWEWVQTDSGCWEIYWTTLPEATLGCGNSSDAVARKVAEGNANVSRQHSSARLWATADVVHMIRTRDNSCASLNQKTLQYIMMSLNTFRAIINLACSVSVWIVCKVIQIVGHFTHICWTIVLSIAIDSCFVIVQIHS